MKKTNHPIPAAIYVCALLILSAAISYGLYLGRNSQELARYNIPRFLEILNLQQPEYFYLFGAGFLIAGCLLKRHWILAMCFALSACGWAIYYEAISTWLMGLGSDSFSEVQNFDLHEALFFIPGMLSIFVPFLPFRRLILYGIIGLVIFFILVAINRKLKLSVGTKFIFCLVIGVSLSSLAFYLLDVRTTSSYESNTKIFNATAKNFDNPPVSVTFTRPLNVVVYIGESTTVMNMGLYGYPRDTTPQLRQLQKQDSNLLVFRNVMSTFTHTSDSLLEALSVGVDHTQDLIPITSRKRIALPDILKRNNIPTNLLSNQGEEGTWNMAGSIIFKHANKKYSVSTSHLGNAEYMIARPYDGDFFLNNIDPLLAGFPASARSVVFLHSFAGHAGMHSYLGAIPESFHSHIDRYYADLDASAIAGPISRVSDNIENYDSAIRYVDHNVASIIEKIKSRADPIVLIYFSDHGESVFTGRGHESSRFIHEMARVPFIMYFNEQARQRYPKLFDQYKKLSETNAISTLAQLPSTILNLLGARDTDGLFLMLDQVGTEHRPYIPPVLVRRTSSGDTYINPNNKDITIEQVPSSALSINATDDLTRMFVARQTHLLGQTSLCHEDINTLAMAFRGALASNCFQLDLNDAGTLRLLPDALGLEKNQSSLAYILELAERNKLNLWINISKIKDEKICQRLIKLAEPTIVAGRQVLIALTSEADLNNPALAQCAEQFKNNSIAFAYRVPRDELQACSSPVRGRHMQGGTSTLPDEKACHVMENKIEQIVSSKIFTDLSFDDWGLAAIEKIKAAKTLKWDAQHVDAKRLLEIQPETFRMIGLLTNDPNSLK